MWFENTYNNFYEFVKFIMSFIPFKNKIYQMIVNILDKSYMTLISVFWGCHYYVYPIYKYNILPIFKKKRIVSYINYGYEFDEKILMNYGLDVNKFSFKMIKNYNIETCNYDIEIKYSGGKEFITNNFKPLPTTYKFVSIFYTDINDNKKQYEIKLNNNFYFCNNIILNNPFLKWYLNMYYNTPISSYYLVTIIDNNITEVKLWNNQSILLLKDEYKIINDKDIIIELNNIDMKQSGDNIKIINNDNDNDDDNDDDYKVPDAMCCYDGTDVIGNYINKSDKIDNITSEIIDSDATKMEDKMEHDDEYMCDNQSISNLAKKYVKPPYKLYSMNWSNNATNTKIN